MKVTVERTPESEAVLNVELEWAELEKASEKAYRKLAQKYKVPGFRPGHAPRAILERMLGKEAIYQEGLEDLIDQSYREALREHNLSPIAQPKVDAPALEIGQPYAFTAHVPILTPVTLGDYKNVRVARPEVTVTGDEVEGVIERIQQDQAMWLPAERPAQVGDQVTMDMKVTAGEKTISDLHDNEFELAEERPGIFAGMDQQVVGMSEGEHKEFTTTIPEDYANPDLAGKEAQFDVTLKAVKFRELPAVDDELAKSLGEFSTMDEVKEAIRDQLLQQKKNDAETALRDQVLDAVTDQAQVTVHPALVDDEVHSMLRETERQLAQSRISMDQFYALSQKTAEEYHKELEPQAEKRVKRDLTLNAVAEDQGIEATDADVEGWLAAFMAMGGKPMKVRQLSANQRANIEARIRRDNALRFLMESATQDEGEATATANAEAAAQAAAQAATPATHATPAETSAAADALGAQPGASEVAQAEVTAAETATAQKSAKAPAAKVPQAEAAQGNGGQTTGNPATNPPTGNAEVPNPSK